MELTISAPFPLATVPAQGYSIPRLNSRSRGLRLHEDDDPTVVTSPRHATEAAAPLENANLHPL